MSRPSSRRHCAPAMWSSSTTCRATKARWPRLSSGNVAHGSSSCRPTAQTSIRSKWPSPSSRPTFAASRPGPSTTCGAPSAISVTSTHPRNAGTSSNTPDMHQIKRTMLYSLTGFYRRSRDGVSDIVQDQGSGVFLSTRANLATGERLGVELVANGRFTKKLTYNASGSFLWNAIDPRQPGVGARRSGTTGTIRASITWQPNAKDFFQLSGNYASRQLIAQGYRAPGGVLNLGYRRKVSERVGLTLTGQNVLDSARQLTIVDTPLLRDRIRQSGSGRILLLGLTWNLGSQSGRRRPEPANEFDQGGAVPSG